VADVNANIGVNIDTSNALSQLKALQRQISQFHTSIAKSSETAALAQRDLQRNFINGVNAIGAFSAELRTIKTTAESFTDALEKNKFSMREYFRFAGASTKTFGKLFRSEFDTINKVAEENVKRLQTQYIKMGRDANGAMRAIAIMPNELDMSKMSTQLQMAAQRQALFNQLVKQGSTNLLNFGKNTQWAGRQLMVGFTLPLASLGTIASRTFMDMETAALKFRKVYGDLFTPAAEREQALADIGALGEMFTKYGISVASTVGLAAEAAAAGFQGLDLQRQTQQATRLSVLGQIEQQKALETTISLQNAFKMSSEDLASSIDFLNAVENQTVVSLDDITTAIPKVAPVIQQLGGDVKDLAFFMAAMKEGGVNASEGANALKSGLAALINPTEKASDMLASMGINIKQIVEANRGDLKGTVIDFARALDTLEPLTRARAIEQLFGKFQFARLSTLFDNVTNQTGQAARVLDLAGTSIEELASLSESELGMTADSAMNKFRKSVEDLKVALVPVGQSFLEAVTPIVEFIGGILDKFNNLSSGVKKAITLITVAIGAIGPVALMTFGLIANGAANLIKGFLVLRNGYLRLTGQSQILSEQTEFLTVEQQRAAAVAHSLDQSHARLTQTFNAEAGAIRALANEYRSALGALQAFAQRNPGMMTPPKKYNKGIVIVPGSGNKDTVPAMLTPGEAVIPADMTQKYGALIEGMIAGNIPGYKRGRAGMGTNVSTPGGYAAAHFGGSSYRSGSELLQMVEGLDTAMAKNIRNMVNEVENGLDRVFTVFTNEVIATSKEFNEALGKTGSGKTAPIGVARKELTEAPYAKVRDIELQRQLEKAGVPIEEIRNINEKVTKEIEVGFTKLGDITEVTGENIDKLVTDAYKAVAETDTRVKNALAEMRQVTAVTDPRKDARLPITKESYREQRKTGKYFAGMERMVGAGNVPFEASAGFRINNQMASAIGLSSADAARVFKQFSDEVKLKLASLRGDITQFTAQFEAEAEKAGLKTGTSYKVGIEKSGLKDIYVESRERTSPHPMASKDGTDDGVAYEKAREGAVTRTRRKVTTGVITPPSIPPVDKTSGGVSMQQVANAAIISEATKRSGEDMVKSARSFQDRMTSLNRTVMGGTFALGSLSGLASLSGGKLGEFAGTISKLNLAMFALMSVTQLLTQTQFTALAANRLAIAQSAVKMAKGGAGIAAMPGMLGKTGFIGSIARAGLFITRLLTPIGALTTLAGLAVIAFKAHNASQERARQKLEAFSDVLSTTTNQTKFLGDYFNFIPMKGSLEQFGKDLEQVAAKTRTAREQLKESEGFQEAYGQTINQVRGMSAEQAQAALTFKGLELISQGMARDQVQLLIDSIKEEAGKKDLKFDFKDIKFDKAGISTLTNELSTALSGFQKTYKDGLEKTFNYVPTGEGRNIKLVESLVPNKEAKAALKNASAGIASYSESLNRLVKSGVIDAKQFETATTAMFDSIEKSVPDTNTRLALFNAVMKSIDPELAKVTKGVKDLEQKQLLLKAAIAGVSANLIMNASIAFRTADALNKVAAANLKAFGVKDTSAEQANNRAKANEAAYNAQNELNKAISDAIALQKKLNAAVSGTGTGTGDGEKSAIEKALEQLRNQQTELANTKKAYALLRAEGVETGRAFEIASDPILAAALAAGKVDPSKWKELWELLKNINTEIVDGKLLEFFDTRTAELGLKQQLAGILPLLKDLGLDIKDVQDILSNPDLARAFIEDLKDGVLNSEKLAKYINQIPELKKVDIILGLQTEEDAFNALKSKADELFGFLERAAQREYKPKIVKAEKEVEAAQAAVDKVQAIIDGYEATIEQKQRNVELTLSRPIEAFQEQINDLQRNMEMNFERPIEALNEQINSIERQIEISFDRPIAGLQADIERMQRSIELGFERPIAALQEESSDLANELELMDRAAEQINQKYDAQEAALQRISDVNQEISAQQKQQLSIADALTQGDISAAAQAAQEARAQAAAAASERASGTLDAARQAQLEALRTRQGMTRVQVEQRQFEISQQVFGLEEQKEAVAAQILIKQDQIYALEQARIPYQDQIKAKQEQIYLLQEKQKATQEQIRVIEDKIYALEELREAALIEIQKTEDLVYNIKNGINVADSQNLVLANQKLKAAQDALTEIKNELQARLDNIDAQKDAWEAAADAQIAAKVAAGEYNDVLKATEDYLKRILLLQQQIAAAAKNATITGATTATSGTSKIVTAPIVQDDKKDDDKKDDPNKDDTPLTPEAAVTAIKNATTTETINAAVNAAVSAGATATNIANAMVQPLIETGFDTASALSSARYTGMAIQYQQQQEAEAKARAELQERMFNARMRARSSGGLMKTSYFAVGGHARGTDTVPAMLTPGEFVMSRYAVKNFGLENMKAINDGSYENESVYNYSVNVNVKSGSNPEEIARAVMTQIKQIDSQRIRGQRVS
jgi:TP901 family phage tail tape measure protein